MHCELDCVELNEGKTSEELAPKAPLKLKFFAGTDFENAK